MPYLFGLKVGAEELSHGQFKYAIRHLVMPVGYWRNVEFRFVLDEGDFKHSDRILDIGSPKLLSLYLAKTLGAEVYATDIDDYFTREYSLLRELEGLPDDRFHVQVEDGRHLSFPDDHFSKVFSVSVIEHIPDHGDSECAKDIARVLAPGGRCLITVPFAPEYQDVYIGPGGVYWAKAAGAEEENRVFFQRRYDEQSLYERVIKPSGLTLRSLTFIGERVLAGSEREFVDYIPFPVSALVGPIQPVLSNLLHTPRTEAWRDLKKPLCACIVLEKPALPSA
jgi:SAM-dependent methyltransferase